MTDMLGRAVFTGDIVVFPYRVSSNMEMKVAKVVDADKRKVRSARQRWNGGWELSTRDGFLSVDRYVLVEYAPEEIRKLFDTV